MKRLLRDLVERVMTAERAVNVEICVCNGMSVARARVGIEGC